LPYGKEKKKRMDDKRIKKIVKDAYNKRKKELKKMRKKELIGIILDVEYEFGLLPYNPLKFKK